MFFDSPPSGIVTEVRDSEVGGGSDAVTQDGDAVEAEADDVARAYAASGDWKRRRLV